MNKYSSNERNESLVFRVWTDPDRTRQVLAGNLVISETDERYPRAAAFYWNIIVGSFKALVPYHILTIQLQFSLPVIHHLASCLITIFHVYNQMILCQIYLPHLKANIALFMSYLSRIQYLILTKQSSIVSSSSIISQRYSNHDVEFHTQWGFMIYKTKNGALLLYLTWSCPNFDFQFWPNLKSFMPIYFLFYSHFLQT